MGSAAFWDDGYSDLPQLITVQRDVKKGLEQGGPNPWDVVYLDGKRVPGLCELTGPDPSLRIDTKKPPGFDGADLTPLGIQPTVLDLKIKFWTGGQWELVQDFIERVWRKPLKDFRGSPAARKTQPIYTIDHPMLVPYGITQVVITACGLPKDADGTKQIKTITLRLHEYVQPNRNKKAPSKVAHNPGIVDPYKSNIPDNAPGDAPSKTIKPKKR